MSSPALDFSFSLGGFLMEKLPFPLRVHVLDLGREGWVFLKRPACMVTILQMIITESHLNNLRTGGSFTTATIRALGQYVNGLTKGWARNLIGKDIPDDVYAKAMAGVGVYSPKTIKIKNLRNATETTRQPEFISFAQPPNNLRPPSVTVSSNDFNDLLFRMQELEARMAHMESLHTNL